MAIAKHTEDLVSHIPAIHLLINIGYQYLAPSETIKLRDGRRSRVVLESVLEDWLFKNNSIKSKSGSVHFSRENIRDAVVHSLNLELR